MLSPKDIATLNDLAEGLSREESAERQQCSEHTIKNALGRLILKFDIPVSDCWPGVMLGVWWAQLPEIAKIGGAVVEDRELRKDFWKFFDRRRKCLDSKLVC